jgi:hypothetical protein
LTFPLPLRIFRPELPIGSNDQQVGAGQPIVKSLETVRPDLDLNPAIEACGLAAGSW